MYDARKLEAKWQKDWAKKKAFQPELSKKKKFLLTVPYPYISGSLHIGHGYAFTQADVRARYLRMRGYNVLFPVAFHISGTPVLGISTAIEHGDKKKIELFEGYVSSYVKDRAKVKQIVSSFKEPWNIVRFFVPRMIEEFSSLGLSIDWTRAFTSGDAEHQALVRWQFNRYNKLGFLTKGSHSVLYCVNDKNAVGEDDIQDADTNPVDKLEFTLIKFKLPGEADTYLVAASLRPETVFGQTNLWVRADAEYVAVRVKDERWIMSKKAAGKITHQRKDVQVTKEVRSGTDLIGKWVLAPGVNREIPIFPSKFVDPDVGSGIVTSVPSDAPYDYIALQDLKKLSREELEKYRLDYDEVQRIEPIPIIETPEYGDMAAPKVCKQMAIKDQADSRLEEATQIVYSAGFHKGKMVKNCFEFNGMPVSEAKEKVKQMLLNTKSADIFYDPSRPAVCRCGGEIIVSVIDDQWFLDFNALGWKDQARRCLEKIEIKPDTFRKQFLDTFEWLEKRPVARRRGLGTKLPIDERWVIESLSDSTMYMTLYAIDDLIKKFKIREKQMTGEFFDYVFLGNNLKGAAKATKLPASKLKKLREEFEYWYPFDQRHTFVGHLSNHLSFMIFAHAALLQEKFWPKQISFHGYVTSEGAKMSKSKGNVVPLTDIRDKYGVDVFRAYISSVASVDGDFDWRASDVANIKKHLAGLFELLCSAVKNRGAGKLSLPSQAFLSMFESSLRRSTEALELMDHRSYATALLYDVPNAYKYLASRVSKKELAAVNKLVADKWIRALAPMIPHIAEELWNCLGKRGLVSLEAWPDVDEKLIRPEVEETETLAMNTAADIREIIKLIGKKPKEIILIVAPEWKRSVIRTTKELISAGKRDTKSVMSVLMKNEQMRRRGGEVTKILAKIMLDVSKMPKTVFGEKLELQVFSSSRAWLEKEFGCKVVLQSAEKSSEAKAGSAMPGKPAIVIR